MAKIIKTPNSGVKRESTSGCYTTIGGGSKVAGSSSSVSTGKVSSSSAKVLGNAAQRFDSALKNLSKR